MVLNSKIYSPEGETPGDKEAAQNEEETSRRHSERRLHVVFLEEASKTALSAEKMIRRHAKLYPHEKRGEWQEFNYWWEGKGKKTKQVEGEEGEEEGRGKFLSRQVFDLILRKIPYEQRQSESGAWQAIYNVPPDEVIKEDILPEARQWAEEIIQWGAEEHLLDFFENEWGTDRPLEIKEKVWETACRVLDVIVAEKKEDVEATVGDVEKFLSGRKETKA